MTSPRKMTVRHEVGDPALTRRRAIAAAASLALSAVLAACRDDGPQTRPVGNPAAAGEIEEGTGVEANVQSIDNTFRPDRIEIASGTAVVWTNLGRTKHDILPVEGDDWGVATDDFLPGATYRHVFTEPGEVPYYCSIHGTTKFGMVGTIVVLDQ